MKIGTQTDNRALNSGDHFLFHPTGRSSPATGRLLDFFDIIADDITYLKSSSPPPAVSHVRLWHLLTVDYRYRRRE